MPWAVTLIVKDCGSMAPLQGVHVSDGVGGGYTDVYGQFIAVIDDAYSSYVVQLSKAYYESRTFTFAKSQSGTVQNTCLTVHIPDETGTGTGDCFIVTAASGSDQSPEVMGMRALRDRVAAAPMAARLIDAVYDQYWRFSPAIAYQIRDNDTARVAVMALVVRPLFAWYQFAGQLALDPGSTAAIAQSEMELRAACPRYLTPARITHYLALLRQGNPLPDVAPTLVLELAPRLREALVLPLIDWAIFEPLQRTWSGAAERHDMRSEVAQWLAGAPLETLAPPAPERLVDELTSLAALLSFDPPARHRLGARLLAAWPQAAPALQQAKLVEQAG